MAADAGGNPRYFPVRADEIVGAGKAFPSSHKGPLTMRVPLSPPPASTRNRGGTQRLAIRRGQPGAEGAGVPQSNPSREVRQWMGLPSNPTTSYTREAGAIPRRVTTGMPGRYVDTGDATTSTGSLQTSPSADVL